MYCCLFIFSVQEVMNFSAITVAERTPAGQRQSVEAESKERLEIRWSADFFLE